MTKIIHVPMVQGTIHIPSIPIDNYPQATLGLDGKPAFHLQQPKTQPSNTPFTVDPMDEYIAMYARRLVHLDTRGNTSTRFDIQQCSFTEADLSFRLWEFREIIEWADENAIGYVLVQCRPNGYTGKTYLMTFVEQADYHAFTAWFQTKHREFIQITLPMGDPTTNHAMRTDGQIEEIRTWVTAHVRGQYEMRVNGGRPTRVSAAFRDPDEALVFKLTWDRAGSD